MVEDPKNSGLSTIWIVIGSILEERDLTLESGDVYRDYQRSGPMFLPRRFRSIP
jgi:protein-S-isoprenylcysteine O-methyltransferase Ste14